MDKARRPPPESRHSKRIVLLAAGNRQVTCSLCRLRVVYDDDHVGLVSLLLSSHWYDHHGIEAFRQEAAEARRELSLSGRTEELRAMRASGW